MDNEEPDRIAELRGRVEKLQAETRLVLADYQDGLCYAEDVEKVVNA